MPENSLAACREFLKDTIRQKIDFSQSDQNQGVQPPPLEKPYPPDAVRIKLLPVGQWQGVELIDLASAIEERQSRRKFNPEPLTLDELSMLLWATQGVRGKVDDRTFRTVPSAGNRHAFETYLAVQRV